MKGRYLSHEQSSIISSLLARARANEERQGTQRLFAGTERQWEFHQEARQWMYHVSNYSAVVSPKLFQHLHLIHSGHAMDHNSTCNAAHTSMKLKWGDLTKWVWYLVWQSETFVQGIASAGYTKRYLYAFWTTSKWRQHWFFILAATEETMQMLQLCKVWLRT